MGGGDNAVEAAIGLGRDGRNRVWLSYRREKIVRARERNIQRLEEFIRRGWVIPLMPSRVVQIRPGEVILETAEGPRTLPADYVFILIGWSPPFELLRSCGIRFYADLATTSA